MAPKYRRLILVKKYLFISILLSITPLVCSAFLYDRYVVSLLDNILTERIDGDIQAAASNMQQLLQSHSERLNNLADIPEIENVFLSKASYELSEKLLDFIYLEVGQPDVYAINFIGVDSHIIRSIPEFYARENIQYHNLPVKNMGQFQLLGPVLPSSGRPGWIGIQRQVSKNGRPIGAILLMLRLASFTENVASLYQKGFYEPMISIGQNTFLSALGTEITYSINTHALLTEPKTIIPDWSIALFKNEKNIEQPRVNIRYYLFIVIALACAAIMGVFFHMSERLAGLIIPLTEGARAIAKGDFSVRISEQSPDELSDLSHSFNQMSEQLGTMIDSRVDAERLGALGNLAAGIAHEIRNPLTTLRTTVHALRHSEKDNEKQEMLELVGEEIIRIDGMVEEFLSYARPHEPSIEKVDMHDFMQSIEALVSGTLSDAGVELQTQYKHSLSVFVDPAQLRQVFMNVILNAVQAMPNGGGITILVAQEEGVVGASNAIITVSDNGIGMDHSTLERVQVPFFTTKSMGSGLGLSICSQLLKKNNGNLSIYSELGKGTDIVIRLPLNVLSDKNNNE